MSYTLDEVIQRAELCGKAEVAGTYNYRRNLL